MLAENYLSHLPGGLVCWLLAMELLAEAVSGSRKAIRQVSLWIFIQWRVHTKVSGDVTLPHMPCA